MQDVGERIARGFVEAERQRRSNVPGAELVEIDGLLLAFANVPDPPAELPDLSGLPETLDELVSA